MGNIIAPRFKGSKESRHRLREALLEKLTEEHISDDGTIRTFWDTAITRLVNTACYAERDSDANSAMKEIFDRLLGNPAVIDNSEKLEMPSVKFILADADSERIGSRAGKKGIPEDTLPDKIIVSVEGMDGEMEL
mgnify:CR=1 FL=1